MPTLTLLQAEGLVVRTLTRCRTSVDNARSVARALIAAEADGLKGHGLSRLSLYAAQAKVRKVDGTFTPVASHPRSGLIAIDAGYGFAFPAIELAEAELLPAAKTQGLAAAAIRKSSHCGAAGHPVERLAENGLVALMFVNTPGAMAPWGGSKALFGTNRSPSPVRCPGVRRW
jgi:(2R)-3-sulfolactate dehydrogenase (NADP+)